MTQLSSARCYRLSTPVQPPGWRWDPDTGFTQTTPIPAMATNAVDTVVQRSPHPADPALLPTPSPPPSNSPDNRSPDMAPHETKTLNSDPPAPDPALKVVSTRFANIIAETLDGKRRPTQLQEWFDPRSVKVLTKQATQMKGTRVRLASVRVQPVSGLAAEVSMRLSTPSLDHAAALRVSLNQSQWVCTDLVIG